MHQNHILLVDDNPDFLHSMHRFLGHLPAITIVGTARSGAEALEKVPQLRPNLVLMDLAMPGICGIAATQQLKVDYPDLKVVILTLHNVEAYRILAMQAGADDFMVKSEVFERLPVLLAALAPEVSAVDKISERRIAR